MNTPTPTNHYSALINPKVIKALLHIASTDETRSAIGGVHFEFFGNDNYVAVATDGRKIAVVKVGATSPWNAGLADCTHTLDLPRTACEAVVRDATRTKHTVVDLSWGEFSQNIRHAGVPLESFLIDKDQKHPFRYPNWRQVMPRSTWQQTASKNRSFDGMHVSAVHEFFDILTKDSLPKHYRKHDRGGAHASCYAIPVAMQGSGENWGWLFRTRCACNPPCSVTEITPLAYLMPLQLTDREAEVPAEFLKGLGL